MGEHLPASLTSTWPKRGIPGLEQFAVKIATIARTQSDWVDAGRLEPNRDSHRRWWSRACAYAAGPWVAQVLAAATNDDLRTSAI